MNHQTYEVHAAEACRKGLPLDPLIAMAFYRSEMRSPAARNFGAGPSKRAYRELRMRVAKPVDLPSDTPYDLSPDTVAWLRRLAA